MTDEIQYSADLEVELVKHNVSDSDAIWAARVSTAGERSLDARDADPVESRGLLRFLLRERHGSPFEHGSMTFRVTMPRFVGREQLRHRAGFCLSGDTRIDPGGKSAKRGGQMRTLRQLHDRWKYGVPIDAERRPGVLRDLPSTHNFKLQTLNTDTNLISVNRAADVFESGEKDLIALDVQTWNRYEPLKCSVDHQIYTYDGWVKAGELSKGDLIATASLQPTLERPIPWRLRQGINEWVGAQRPRVLLEAKNRCYICDTQFDPNRLEIDHIVPVAENILRALDVTNLAPVCADCHSAKTITEQKYAQRSNRWSAKFMPLRNTPEIVSREMTYDISVDGEYKNFIANGIVVHNSYNEESGRYRKYEPNFYVPGPTRPSVQVGKPGAYSFELGTQEQYDLVVDAYITSITVAWQQYNRMLDGGIAREMARGVLPEAIFSTMYITCNARSLMHYLSLRTKDERAEKPSYPQWEIEQVARKMEAHFAELMPITYEAFNDYGRVAP